MQGVFPLVSEVLDSYPCLHFIVISDGCIFDSKETTNAAVKAHRKFLSKTQSSFVGATLIRLQTSPGASPDTSALSCVGNFCNNGVATPLVDVDNLVLLKSAVFEGLKTGGASHILLSSADGSDVFKQAPFSKKKSQIYIPCGVKSFVLIEDHVDNVLIGGSAYPVTNIGVPKTIETISPYIDFVGCLTKMQLLVPDLSVSTKSLETTLTFLNNIQELFREDVDDGRSHKRRVDKIIGTSIDKLRRELNSINVLKLNSQQKADWLRGVSDSKSGRSLARRRKSNEVDAGSALSSLAKALEEFPGHKCDVVSFYSLSTPIECLEGAEKLQHHAVDDNDWQRCIGGVGVPVCHNVGDYVDPWTVRVKDV